MADKRNPAGTGIGAPGTTGAFKTSDPLGAPGSTGAGITHHDPTANITSVGSDYEDPDLKYGGGQQQQLRDPTSGEHGFGRQQQFHDLTSGDYGGGQHQQHRDLTSGDYGGGQQHHFRDPTSGVHGGQHHQFRDPTSGVHGGQQQQQHQDLTSRDYGGAHHQQHRDPTSGLYSGVQQQQIRDPTSGVIGSGDELERDRAGHGPVGVTGYTKVTTATTPGGGVMYGRETVARAEKLGTAGAGSDERAREMKDRVQGGTHSR